ncbi:MAG: hypothetical protein ACPW60_05885 [Methylohalobius sp. ZOD2]|nr:hypothetical protein [Methylothermaceae bacterium]
MWEKFIKNKYSVLLLIVYVIALYVILNKVVVPFVLNMTESEFFTGDSSEGGEAAQVHNERTAMALLQCNGFVREKYEEDTVLVFDDKAHQSWDIGFGRFLIKSRVMVTEPGEAAVRQQYVCELKHTGGDLADHDNWKLTGLSITDVAATQ